MSEDIKNFRQAVEKLDLILIQLDKLDVLLPVVSSTNQELEIKKDDLKDTISSLNNSIIDINTGIVAVVDGLEDKLSIKISNALKGIKIPKLQNIIDENLNKKSNEITATLNALLDSIENKISSIKSAKEFENFLKNKKDEIETNLIDVNVKFNKELDANYLELINFQTSFNVLQKDLTFKSKKFMSKINFTITIFCIIFGFTVGICGGYFSSTLFEDKKVENIVDFRNFIANKKIQLVKYPDGVKIIYKDKIVHENEFVDDVKIIKINDLNLRVWSFRDNNYFDELLLE